MARYCTKHRILTTDFRQCFLCEDEPHFKGKPLERQLMNTDTTLLITELSEFEALKAHRPELFELIYQMVATSNAKGQDYGGEDTYSNLRASEAYGIPAWKGCLIRKQDKLSRIKNFVLKQYYEVKDETFEDTLLDDAVYSLLTILMYREWKKKNAD